MLTSPAPGLVRLRELCVVLEREERALQTAFLKSPDLMTVIDQEGFVVQLNYSWQKLLGWGPELCHTKLIDLVHEDDQAEFQCELDSNSPIICRIRHKDGDYRCVEFTVNCRYEDRYNLVGHLASQNVNTNHKNRC